jgi:hypothetical protein
MSPFYQFNKGQAVENRGPKIFLDFAAARVWCRGFSLFGNALKASPHHTFWVGTNAKNRPPNWCSLVNIKGLTTHGRDVKISLLF